MPRGVYERKPRKAQVVPDAEISGGGYVQSAPPEPRSLDARTRSAERGMTGKSGFSKEVEQQFFEHERQTIAGTTADESVVSRGKKEMINRYWLTADMLGAAVKAVKDAGGDDGCLKAAADAFETGIMQLITAIIKI